MTQEELNRVPFHVVTHLALADEHCLTFSSADNRLGFCKHTPKRKDGTFGKGYTHYRIDTKVYKSRQKWLEALKDFQP